MEGLADIATTGAPVIVTVLGMGTVFVCLTLLYAMTSAIGTLIPWAMAAVTARARAAAAPVVAAGSDAAETSDGETGDDRAALVAALTLVLARHRSARARPPATAAAGGDPWKIAGRIRTFQGR